MRNDRASTTEYQLAILRHAKSDWGTGLPDRERPLNVRGLQEAPLIGQWLQQHDWTAERILASPATRVRQTLGAVFTASGGPPPPVEWRETFYLADRDHLLRTVRDTGPAVTRLMLVGHNPGLEELLVYLCELSPELTSKGKLLTTANLAILTFDKPWSQIKAHSGHLLALIRPKELQE